MPVLIHIFRNSARESKFRSKFCYVAIARNKLSRICSSLI